MSSIKTFARVKPTDKPYDDFDTTLDRLYFRLSDGRENYGNQNKSKSGSNTVNHEFKFNSVFNAHTTQEEVFEKSAKEIVEHFLNGYNGTIFAYGQTGSGKTHTVEGSARRYEDRGLAPRALSLIYKALESRQNEDISVHLSYMEIYQEVGYDLLNSGARTNSMVTPLSKVVVVEGAKGAVIVRNLSTHLAANEEVAQNLLLQGQANRKVGETPMNQRSSRSHAVFTIQLSSRKPDSDTIVKSKLHLVDLAGSERVAKTGVAGLQLTEAKYINLSLHHLEGVIIALQREAAGLKGGPLRSQSSVGNAWNRNHPYSPGRRSRSGYLSWMSNPYVNLGSRPTTADTYSKSKHIPYRNSLLTMVLKDSLGGNCLTAMIATISIEEYNLGETISTCRFAQRVACVANNARKNEEIDDKSMIKRLRKRISELEEEVAYLKANQYRGITEADITEFVNKLTDEDKLMCSKVMQGYIGGKIADPIIAGITDPYKFKECLRILKSMIMEHYARGDIRDTSSRPTSNTDLVTRPSSNISGNSALSTATSGFDETMTPLLEGDEPKSAVLNSGPKKVAWVQSAPAKSHRKAPSIDDSDRPATSFMTRSVDSGKGMFMSGDLSRKTSTDTLSRSTPIFEVPGRMKYKSPFERKREKEIKKLQTKIEKTYDEHTEQQQHLAEFQTVIKEQQLELLEKELSSKLDATRRQISDQQSYLIDLKHDRADHELIEQEKLVERQLRKRESKMDKRLKVVRDELQKVRQEYKQQKEKFESERTESPERKSTPYLEEKYPQYVKRDGKLNTRQVLSMLEQQNKKQLKTQNEIDQQRVLSVTSQLEVKEAATRQKLQEFKEKLKAAKMGFGFTTSFDSTGSFSSPEKSNSFDNLEPQFNSTAKKSPRNQENDHRQIKSPPADGMNDRMVKPKPVYANGHHSPVLNGHVSHEKSPRYSAFSPIKDKDDIDVLNLENEDEFEHNPRKNLDKNSHSHTNSKSPKHNVVNGHVGDYDNSKHSIKKNMFTFQPHGSSRSPERHHGHGFHGDKVTTNDHWNSGYSTKRTTSPERAKHYDTLHNKNNQFSSQRNNDMYGDNDLLAEYIKPSGSSKDNSVVSDRDSSKFTGAKFLSILDQDYSTPSNTTIEEEATLTKHHKHQNSKEKRRQYYKALLKATKNNKQGGLSKKDMDMLDFGRKSRSKSRENDRTRNDSFEKYTPSEYINKTDQTFDARKMGLSSKTFDSALSSILAKEGMSLEVEYEDYDKFASTRISHRKPKRQTSPNKDRSRGDYSRDYSRSPTRESQRQNKSDREKKKHEKNNKKNTDTWGPEARHSVKENLTKFLQDLPAPKPKSKKKGMVSYDDSALPNPRSPRSQSPDLKQQSKPKMVEYIPDMDEYRPKIKALPENDREKSYMTTVKEQKDRVARIRKARHAAEVIQKAWRRFQFKKRLKQR